MSKNSSSKSGSNPSNPDPDEPLDSSVLASSSWGAADSFSSEINQEIIITNDRFAGMARIRENKESETTVSHISNFTLS